MTKDELIKMLKTLEIPIYEGDVTKGMEKYPRINIFDYVWEDVMSSGEVYEEVETYQISFFSLYPRHEKLLQLRRILREKGLHPTIYHEYTIDENKKRCVHSYFKVEVSV